MLPLALLDVIARPSVKFEVAPGRGPGLEAPGLSDRRCLDYRRGPTPVRSRARLKVPSREFWLGPGVDLTRDAEDARAHQDDARRGTRDEQPELAEEAGTR